MVSKRQHLVGKVSLDHESKVNWLELITGNCDMTRGERLDNFLEEVISHLMSAELLFPLAG